MGPGHRFRTIQVRPEDLLTSVWQADRAVDRLFLVEEAPCPALDGASSSR